MRKPHTTRRIPQGWLAFGLLAATFTYCLAEEVTLTTYYPSPRGVYKELRTIGNTFLATEEGNVGIGTTSPNLYGRPKALTFSAGASGDVLGMLELQGSRTSGGQAIVGIAGFNGATNIGLIDFVTGASTDSGQIVLYTKPSGGGIAARMTINDNGNVGIGTTSPHTQLEVGGGATNVQGWAKVLSSAASGVTGVAAHSGSKMVSITAYSVGTGGLTTFDYSNNTTFPLNFGASNYVFTNPATGVSQASIDGVGNPTFNGLAGGSGAYVCANASGTLYRKDGGCP